MYITSNPNQVPIGSRDFLSFGCKVYPLHSLQGDDKMPWPAGFLLERSTSFHIQGKATWKRHCFWLDVFVLANLGDSSSSNSGITNRYPSSLARCLQTLEATWKTQLSIWAIWVIWVIPVGKVLLMMTHPKRVETLHQEISRVDLPSGRRPRWRRRTRRPHQTDPTAHSESQSSESSYPPNIEYPEMRPQINRSNTRPNLLRVSSMRARCVEILWLFIFWCVFIGSVLLSSVHQCFCLFFGWKKIAISDWGTQSSKPLDGMRSKFPPLLCIILITCFPFQIPNHQNPRFFSQEISQHSKKRACCPSFPAPFGTFPAFFSATEQRPPAPAAPLSARGTSCVKVCGLKKAEATGFTKPRAQP